MKNVKTDMNKSKMGLTSYYIYYNFKLFFDDIKFQSDKVLIRFTLKFSESLKISEL